MTLKSACVGFFRSFARVLSLARTFRHNHQSSSIGTKHAFYPLNHDSAFKEKHVFYPLNDNQNIEDITTIVVFFHGFVRGGRYAADSEHLINWTRSQLGWCWLNWIEEERPNTKVYIASYEKLEETCEKSNQIDFYSLGKHLFDGILEVWNTHVKISNNCHVVLIGHSIGGLATKQLIVQAELGHENFIDEFEEDPSLSFLSRVAGIFYFSTPHSDLGDLTRLVGRSKSRLGAAFVALGKVPQRLNHQFMERRKLLGIRTAEVLETSRTRVGSFNDIVVSEGSGRMDVDIVVTAAKDHFSVCQIDNRSDSRFMFLLDQIDRWVLASQVRAGEIILRRHR